MKKVLAWILILAMLFAICGCQASGQNDPTSTQPSSDPTQPSSDPTQPSSDPTQPSSDPTEPSSDPTQPPTGPSQEEKVLMQQLYYINEFLLSIPNDQTPTLRYIGEDGTKWEKMVGNDAYEFCYRFLTEHPNIKMWEEFCMEQWGHVPQIPQQEYLSRFTVIPDMMLRVRSTKRPETTFMYDKQGRFLGRLEDRDYWELYETDLVCEGERFTYEYAEDGTISKIYYGYHNKIGTPVYDSNGRTTMIEIRDYYSDSIEGRILHHYDDQGQRIKTEYPTNVSGATRYVIDYTYDSNGNMVRAQKSRYQYDILSESDYLVDQVIMEYKYNTAGVLLSGTETTLWYELWSAHDPVTNTYTAEITLIRQKADKYTFTYKGDRLISYKINYGKTYYMSGDMAGTVYSEPQYTTDTYTFEFGDYYYYNVPDEGTK